MHDSVEAYAAFDAEGRPADDDAAITRVTVSDASGVVRSEINYLDNNGQPVPMDTATHAITTSYDAEGSVVGSYDALDDD